MANDIVKKQWTAFRKLVIHPQAHPTQVSEMRNAFYAGAQMIVNEMIRISSQENEQKSHYEMESIEKEFQEYAERLNKKHSH